MTRTFQIGLAIESFLNIIGAAQFVLYPDWCLSFAVARGPKLGTAIVPPSAAVLWQVYGAMVLALTVPLIQCIPNSKAVAEKRRITFQTLIAGEIALESLLVWHATRPDQSGFTSTALWLSAVNLVPALTWHSFVVYVKPGMMQSTDEAPTKPSKKRR
ncbi:hypothetical protein GGR52DRAFT_253648 [Hypoxylon sp. FL1284]|nr:hypothetical protein GGR52DRAFT_253648 [Hypoxylon sp. FL1284]